jgi:hypothetical protein
MHRQFHRIETVETVEAVSYLFIYKDENHESGPSESMEIFIPSVKILTNPVATFYGEEARNWYGELINGELKETTSPLTKIRIPITDVLKLVETANARKKAEDELKNLNSSDFHKKLFEQNNLGFQNK